jgi:hypothetical protein
MGWAVVSGTKRIENRPRALPKWMQGRRTLVAVHGGKGWSNEYVTTVSRIMGFMAIPDDGPEWTGIIGAMILTGRQFTESTRPFRGVNLDPWWGGPFGYEIEWAAALPTPIQCRGMMGWWTVPPEHENALRELVPVERVFGTIEEPMRFAA